MPKYADNKPRGRRPNGGIRRFASVAAVVFLSLGLAGCDDYLGADEVKELLSGNTVKGTSGDGRAYFVYFAPDGANRMQTFDGFIDEGRWRITAEGRYCGKWRRVRAGVERCFDVGRADGDTLTFERGDEVHQMHLIRGDAKSIGQ